MQFENIIKPLLGKQLSVRRESVPKQLYPRPTVLGVMVGELKAIVTSAVTLSLVRRENDLGEDGVNNVATTSLPMVFARFVVAIISADLTFYLVHRVAHTRLFYGIHKTHHEFRDTSSAVAGHKHWLEYIVVTVTDVLPFLLAGSTVSELIAYGCVGAFYNAEGHRYVRK